MTSDVKKAKRYFVTRAHRQLENTNFIAVSPAVKAGFLLAETLSEKDVLIRKLTRVFVDARDIAETCPNAKGVPSCLMDSLKRGLAKLPGFGLDDTDIYTEINNEHPKPSGEAGDESDGLR